MRGKERQDRGKEGESGERGSSNGNGHRQKEMQRHLHPVLPEWAALLNVLQAPGNRGDSILYWALEC